MNTFLVDKMLASPRLPTLPAVALQVLELTRKAEPDLEQIAAVIRNDQALALRVLRTVNSSFYALPKPCATIRQAIVLLGLNTVKILVLGFSLADSVNQSSDECVGFNYVEYWRRALYSAVAAKQIAEHARCIDPEAAFLAALIQDFGMVALYRVLGDDYLRLVDQVRDDHRSLPALETQNFEIDHAEAGAQIAQTWRLPSQLVHAVRHHHDSTKAPVDSRELARLVELGAHAAAILMQQNRQPLTVFNDVAQKWFGFTAQQATELMTGIGAAATELSALFRVQIGSPPDVDRLLAQAEEQFTAHQAQMTREAESLRQSNEYLASQAMQDPLTAVANRRRFDLQLAYCFEEARSCGGCVGLIFGDIDHFKKINDAHGHQAGDLVLAELAGRMRKYFGQAGDVCRYGGEEFAIILPGADRVRATRLAEGLRRIIESEPIDVSAVAGRDLKLCVTMSFGVAALEEGVREVLAGPHMLVRVADQAVYAAKSAGRNCVRVFNGARRSQRAA